MLYLSNAPLSYLEKGSWAQDDSILVSVYLHDDGVCKRHVLFYGACIRIAIRVGCFIILPAFKFVNTVAYQHSKIDLKMPPTSFRQKYFSLKVWNMEKVWMTWWVTPSYIWPLNDSLLTFEMINFWHLTDSGHYDSKYNKYHSIRFLWSQN